jgi:hypothetical protein
VGGEEVLDAALQSLVDARAKVAGRRHGHRCLTSSR